MHADSESMINGTYTPSHAGTAASGAFGPAHAAGAGVFPATAGRSPTRVFSYAPSMNSRMSGSVHGSYFAGNRCVSLGCYVLLCCDAPYLRGEFHWFVVGVLCPAVLWCFVSKWATLLLCGVLCPAALWCTVSQWVTPLDCDNLVSWFCDVILD
jgi:hypothetical protein